MPRRPASPQPEWKPGQDRSHRDKHVPCFAKILQQPEGSIGVSMYCRQAQYAINRSWAEFEATTDKHGRGAYYIDPRLVRVVLSPDGSTIYTAHHMHFAVPSQCDEIVSEPEGDRRLRFTKDFQAQVAGQVYKDVKIVRGLRG